IDRLGLLDAVRNAGAVAVKSACIRADGAEVSVPFERPGLGISRTALDAIFSRNARVEQGHIVDSVKRVDGGFRVDDIACRVVIDASGKLGRFTKRQTVNEFGIQYT